MIRFAAWQIRLVPRQVVPGQQAEDLRDQGGV